MLKVELLFFLRAGQDELSFPSVFASFHRTVPSHRAETTLTKATPPVSKPLPSLSAQPAPLERELRSAHLPAFKSHKPPSRERRTEKKITAEISLSVGVDFEDENAGLPSLGRRPVDAEAASVRWMAAAEVREAAGSRAPALAPAPAPFPPVRASALSSSTTTTSGRPSERVRRATERNQPVPIG